MLISFRLLCRNSVILAGRSVRSFASNPLSLSQDHAAEIDNKGMK